MRLVMNDKYKAYKFEYFGREEYNKITQILDCFKKNSEIILYMLPQGSLDYYGTKLVEFIMDRVKHITKGGCSLPAISYGEDTLLYWFELKIDEEFNEMVSLKKRKLFYCIVVNSNSGPKDYSFELEFQEFGRFVIREKIKGDFMSNIFPKLQQIIKDIECVEGADDEEY